MDPWSFAIFLSVVLLVLGIIHLFLYKQIVSALGIQSRRTLNLLRVLFVVLAVSYPVARWLDGFAAEGVVHAAHWAASVWMGLMFHLLWILLGLLIVRLLLKPCRIPPRPLKRWTVLAGVAAALVLCVVAMFEAREAARVRHVTVPVTGITPELRELRIVVAADLHAGVLVDGAEARKRVDEINALKPDLVLMPGDIIDHPPERMIEVADALSKLQARHGVIVSTGNHEYIVGVKAAVRYLRAAGLTVLVNERVELPNGLVVAGVADASAPRFGEVIPPIEEIVGQDAPSRPVILLAHTPGTDDVRAGAAAGADLQLSGHTHGGQMWPFSYLTRLAFPFHHGLYEVGDGHQLTTCGHGWWGPPMRLGVPPEIFVVRLVERSEAAEIDGSPAAATP